MGTAFKVCNEPMWHVAASITCLDRGFDVACHVACHFFFGVHLQMGVFSWSDSTDTVRRFQGLR